MEGKATRFDGNSCHEKTDRVFQRALTRFAPAPCDSQRPAAVVFLCKTEAVGKSQRRTGIHRIRFQAVTLTRLPIAEPGFGAALINTDPDAISRRRGMGEKLAPATAEQIDILLIEPFEPQPHRPQRK